MTRQIALFGLMVTAACASDTRTEEPRTAQQVPANLQMDQDFMTRAASAGMFEVESSRLALSRPTGSDITELAQEIIRDHSQANDKLRQLADSKGVDLPEEMLPEHRTRLEQLQQAQGDQFDQTYEQVQLQAHREAIELFQRCAQYCQDNEVRDYAATTLPALQAHLRHTQEAQATARTPAP
jgi:putative membrane protein